MKLLCLLAPLLALLAAVAPAAAQTLPSAIPAPSGMKPVEGAAFVNYRSFVAGTPEWKRLQDSIDVEMEPARVELEPLWRKTRAAGFALRYFEAINEDDRREIRTAMRPEELTEYQAALDRVRGATASGSFDLRLALIATAKQQFSEASRAFGRAETAVAAERQKRVDALLNPLVPALRSDLDRFGRERGLGPIGFLTDQYLIVVPHLKMRDVTAEFLAWRAGPTK